MTTFHPLLLAPTWPTPMLHLTTQIPEKREPLKGGPSAPTFCGLSELQPHYLPTVLERGPAPWCCGDMHPEHCPSAVPFLSCSFSNLQSLAIPSEALSPCSSPRSPRLPSSTFSHLEYYPVIGQWPHLSFPSSLCFWCPAHTTEPRIFVKYSQSSHKDQRCCL